jgi:hypothetical protein
MNYMASISDFFKSPKWVTNLLFSGLCVLSMMVIPLLGALVLVGWLVTGFWMRKDDRFETFPDFDFKYFGDYLQRGLWPCLVSMVAGLVVGIVMWILILIPMLILGMIAGGSNGHGSGILGAFAGLISLGLYGVMFIAMSEIMLPIALRAVLMQDFVAAFNVAFIKRFVGLMWKEVLISSLFMMVASLVLCVAGMIAVCVGFFLAVGLTYFAWMHLSKQLYQLYLSRGGEPIPVSPKLTEAPVIPPAPMA